jgi:hypothetical protein
VVTAFIILIAFVIVNVVTPWDVLGLARTAYAEDYTHEKFSKLVIGDSTEKTIQLIGTPLMKWRLDSNYVVKYSNSNAILEFFNRDNSLDAIHELPSQFAEEIKIGMSEKDVESLLGSSTPIVSDKKFEWWEYSERDGHHFSYWQVTIKIDVKKQTVVEKRSEFYWD